MLEPQRQTQDARLFLQDELLRRCKTNPKYSLRAFARFLAIEPSALAKILSGKRAITRDMLKRFAQRLAIEPRVLQNLEDNIVSTRGQKKQADASSVRLLPNYQQVTLDHFHIISDWYHYAILELTAVEGFQPQPKWIARILGITPAEAQAASERLMRLEFLEVDSNGRWIDRAGSITNIQNEFTTIAHRKLQKQILMMAAAALEEVSVELRDNTGMTMAIDRDLIPEAKKKIGQFRRELCEFLQSGKRKNAVYQLGIALYPLTQEPSLKNRKMKTGKKK